MSGFAWLNASTISAIVSEAGGVCSVQNLTSVAPDWHSAPVTADPDGSPPDAPALVDGLAPPALGLAALGLHADAMRTIATVSAHGDRETDRLIAPP
jgi:hypothetical protein